MDKIIQELIEESKNFGFGKGRNQIKPFASLGIVWQLLENIDFGNLLKKDKKFYLFIRKKIFWVLDENIEEYYLKIRFTSETDDNEQIVSIADQILLVYFEENLTFLDLESIALEKDSYNALLAWQINAKRGKSAKAGLN